MLNPRFWMLLGLTLLVAAMRLIPHVDNFAPVMAVFLFCGAIFRNRWVALAMPLAAMMVSDGLLYFLRGNSPAQQWIVYTALIVGGLMSMAWLRNKRTPLRVLGTTLAASVAFFLITNFALFYPLPQPPETFGYPHTWEGIWTSYINGLPFFRAALAADMFYSIALFGGFALLERKWSAIREPQPVPVTA